MKKTYYYKTYHEDIVTNANQDYELPEEYKWVHHTILYRIQAKMIYCIAWIIGFFYCKFGLHVKIENKKVLKKYKDTGYFLYGNHTQVLGDVFIPSQVCGTKRIYTVVSPSNLGLKVIGKILPQMGALPIPKSLSKMKDFTNAVKGRIKEKKCVVIYPEAHVWPYCTKIRPFEDTSFKFPIECNVPAFCMTTTYYKRKFFKKPGIKVYVDGPFYPDEKLDKKKQQKELKEAIYECMNKRSKNSNYEYVKYVKL